MSCDALTIVATGLPKTLEDYQVALNAAFAGGRAFGQAEKQEQDPCPSCRKGGVCRTPSCGRLKLPVDHPLRTHPQPKRELLTDEMVVAAARMLSDRHAAACNVDCGDIWKLHGDDFIEDARAMLSAAHGIATGA